MRDYEIQARAMLQKLYPYIEHLTGVYNISNAVAEFNYKNKTQIELRYGSTRIALICDDFVIKFNYDGWGSGTFGNGASEVRMYRKAVKDGFGYLFAPIVPVRKGYDRTFYIMPKIHDVGKFDDDAEEFLNTEECAYIHHNVGDTHYENYGWENDHIVLIDYAYNITVWQ